VLNEDTFGWHVTIESAELDFVPLFTVTGDGVMHVGDAGGESVGPAGTLDIQWRQWNELHADVPVKRLKS
jgi:hypothetical protein